MAIRCGVCLRQADVIRPDGEPRCSRHADIGAPLTTKDSAMPKPTTLAELPAAYQRLAELQAHVEMVADGGVELVVVHMAELLAAVVDELWRAGQVERQAIDAHEYDQPLWCKGAHLDDVRRIVGTAPAATAPRRFEYGPRDSRPADNHNLARTTNET